MRFGLRLMFVATTMAAIVIGVGWPLYKSYTEEFVVYSKGVTVGAKWGWIESTEMLASKGNAAFIFGNAHTDLPSRLDGENLAYLVVVDGESSVEEFWSGVAPDGTNQRRALAKCILDSTPIRMEYCVSVDRGNQQNSGASLSTSESLAIDRATFDLSRGRLIYLQVLNGNLKTTQARLSSIPADIFKGDKQDNQAQIEKALRWWASNMPEKLRPKGPFGI